jgi:hypothetical protein
LLSDVILAEIKEPLNKLRRYVWLKPQSRLLLEKLKVDSLSQEILRVFMEPRSLLPCSQEPATGPFYARELKSTTSSPVPLKSTLIISSHLSTSSQWSTLPSGLPNKLLYAFLISRMRTTSPTPTQNPPYWSILKVLDEHNQGFYTNLNYGGVHNYVYGLDPTVKDRRSCNGEEKVARHQQYTTVCLMKNKTTDSGDSLCMRGMHSCK